MNMKGKLLIIGGAENKEKTKNTTLKSAQTILTRFIEESRLKKKSRIEIITTASTVPEEMGSEYIKTFKELEATNTGILAISDRNETDAPETLKRLEKADAVFFCGGDQLRLTAILGGTQFHNLLQERLKKDDFMFAGTSAGAAAASESMLVQGNSDRAAYKGEVVTTTGLCLLKNIIFDTHFIARGRIGRLFEIVVSNPTVLGVGLDEDTALLIQNDKMEAVGPGMTIILDGLSITDTNLLQIREGAPLSVSNFTLHVMSKTDVFDIKKRKLNIITPPEEKVTE